MARAEAGNFIGHKYAVRAYLINIGCSDPNTTETRWAVVDSLTNTIPLITYSLKLAKRFVSELNSIHKK